MIRVGCFTHWAPRRPRPVRVAARRPIFAFPAEPPREPRRLPIPIHHRGASPSTKHGKARPLIVSHVELSNSGRPIEISGRAPHPMSRLYSRLRLGSYKVVGGRVLGSEAARLYPSGESRGPERVALRCDMCSTGSDLDRRWGRQATSSPDKAIHVRLHGSTDGALPMAGDIRCLRGAAYAVPSAFDGPYASRSLALHLLSHGGSRHSGKC